jgi:UDP-3-O-[3-hydroxymyristoyl] glucosamine N-acyltransferase
MKLRDIARLVGGEVAGDPELDIRGAAGAGDAREGDITFAIDKRNLEKALEGDASCIIVKEPVPGLEKAQLIVESPLYAFAVLLGHFFKPCHGPGGVNPQAFVAKGVSFGDDVSVHPFACISEGAAVGSRTVIYPGAFVGRGASIGEECVIYPNVVIREGVQVGDRVIIHPGAVLGADGFGYVPHGGRHFKIPQVGVVVVEDDVEIGANSTIDRATTGSTVISKGAKIDNLVQVAHNVTIGENTIIVAQCGISGSVKVGKNVMMGGQCGIADHVEIADGTMLAARSGVMSSLKTGAYGGAPTIPFRDWLKAESVFARLPELNRRISELERKLKETGGRRDDDGR